MIVTKHSALVAAAILRLISLSAAVPSPSPGAGGLLSKRSILSWEDCGDDNDPRRKKAGQAFADAAQLARWTFDKKLDDGTAFADTKALVHKNQESSILRLISGEVIRTTTRTPTNRL